MVRRRVVVAQDEQKLLEDITEGLTRAGFEAVPATNGIEAYEAMERGEHDAAILDVSLPAMSGFRLVRLLRRHPRLRRVPLVVTTAFSFDEIEELADEGVEAFVVKPFDTKDLLMRLEHALAQSQRNQLDMSVHAAAIA